VLGQAFGSFLSHGWAVIDHFLDAALSQRLRKDAIALTEARRVAKVESSLSAQRRMEYIPLCGRTLEQAPTPLPQTGTRLLWARPERRPAAEVADVGDPGARRLLLRGLEALRTRLAPLLLAAAPEEEDKQTEGATDGAGNSWVRLAPTPPLPSPRTVLEGEAETEVQYAIYEPGGYFRMHSDAMIAWDLARGGFLSRLVSVIVFLTDPDWDAARDGGAVRLYRPMPIVLGAEALQVATLPTPVETTLTTASTPSVDIEPRGGRLCIFGSPETMHEVLQTRRPRYAAVAWFYSFTRTGLPRTFWPHWAVLPPLASSAFGMLGSGSSPSGVQQTSDAPADPGATVPNGKSDVVGSTVSAVARTLPSSTAERSRPHRSMSLGGLRRGFLGDGAGVCSKRPTALRAAPAPALGSANCGAGLHHRSPPEGVDDGQGAPGGRGEPCGVRQSLDGDAQEEGAGRERRQRGNGRAGGAQPTTFISLD